MEADTGTAVSPDDVLAAAVIGHVRRVVIDGAGVVVDAGRKRRLFSGVARQMALLLAHSCDHLGCTIPARHCQVDHLAEWERDDGGTDQANSKPRCDTHNPWKTAHRLRSKRDEFGNVVDVRDDGTALAPVGRRLHFDDSDDDDRDVEPGRDRGMANAGPSGSSSVGSARPQLELPWRQRCHWTNPRARRNVWSMGTMFPEFEFVGSY